MSFAPLERLKIVVRAEVRVDEFDHDSPFRPFRDGHQKRDSKKKMRRNLLDEARIEARRFRDGRIGSEVARAAVDHSARIAACSEGKIVTFEQRDLEPA